MTTAFGPVWRRSSFSGDGGTGGGNCVELALCADRVAVRDSKRVDSGRLELPRSSLDALLRHVSVG